MSALSLFLVSVAVPAGADPSSTRSLSFINDVIPVLTRAGCNQGACHGAAAGKNGFRLSLRGYAPELDYASITRGASGRRVDKTRPERSLLLRKPLLEVAHRGGPVLKRDSVEHRILSAWLAEGAPGPIPKEARLVSLQARPRSAALAPKAQHQIKVSARFSDGSSRDVTHWARF